MMKNLSNMLEQAKKMQEKLNEAELSGQAGAGLVNVVLTGKGEMKKLTIDPSLLEDKDVTLIEDLVTAAYHDAHKKVQNQMSELTSGFSLPKNFKMPF